MRTRIQDIARWPAVVACATAIFASSTVPAVLGTRIPRRVPRTPLATDKIAHAGEFALLGFLIAGALQHDGTAPMRPATSALAATAAGTLLGALDELHQRSVRGRVAAWDDVAADALGSAAGALLAALVIDSTPRDATNGRVS
jgi:VanZ family protein